MVLLQRVRVVKTDHGVELHWLSGKKNVPGAAVSKEGHADSLLGYEKNPLQLISLKKVHL